MYFSVSGKKRKKNVQTLSGSFLLVRAFRFKKKKKREKKKRGGSGGGEERKRKEKRGEKKQLK